MRFNTLQQWLDWQETLNPKDIDLGLDRVQQVLTQLNLTSNFVCPVITVAGTNGKGSCVAMLTSILDEAGYAVGCYTSPHLFAYNERIRIKQKNVDDDLLCEAFEQVDQARGDVPLTYFEFGTLAALYIFSQQSLDVVILEVGLGGRLDAVNVIDADVALITTVDIDHTDWLGPDIESIAREKAGIMRSHRPAVFGSLSVPTSLVEHARDIQSQLLVAGKDYLYQAVAGGGWQLKGSDIHYSDLPQPALQGAYQLQNAAAVIVALNQLDAIDIDASAIARGLVNLQLTGRYQYIHQQPQVIVDVAHNAQAVRALSELLQQQAIEGNTLAVVAMLADKAIDEVINIMSPVVDQWFTAGLTTARGLSANAMAKAVNAIAADVKLCPQQSVADAVLQALQQAKHQDRIIVFGSFHTVTEASETLKHWIEP